ncbi:MAG TPA: enoyl-CoA hydratase [Solimonas sp.]|nr:enoyl-CoA hydratase [Solimonas sp.]
MSTDLILTDLQDRVLTIRFNRPDKKNALSAAMYVGVTEALKQADADPQVRVILLTGTADCFTSGNDLADFLKNPPSGDDSPVARFMATLPAISKPVVAAVNGVAVGVGTTLLLHCDLVYAGENARFHMPFVSLGLCPEFASSLILPAIAGHAAAAELLLLAEPFSAARAREAGIVNAVLPDAEVQAHARAQALKLAQQPPQAVRTSKALLKRWTATQVETAVKEEAPKFMAMLRQPEALEAMGAFMQKRKPDFSRFS